MQRILERSDKFPFDKGGFRGNVDALITRKGELFDSPFLCDPVGARTQDLQLRRLLLYPTELRNQHLMSFANDAIPFCAAKVSKIYRFTKFLPNKLSIYNQIGVLQ